MGWVASSVLAAVFLIAAASKVTDRTGTRHGAAGLGVPARAEPAVAVALPAIEAGVAVLLLTPWHRVGAWAAIALLVVFTCAVARTLAHGHQPACRCFGSLSTRPIGAATLLRNAVLGAVAAVVLLAPSEALPAASMLGWIAAGSIAAIGGAVLVAVLRQQGRLLARVEAIEAGLVTTSLEPFAQHLSRPVPRPAPAFSLVDCNQLEWSLTQLTDEQGVMLLFVDRDCPTCHEALPWILAERRHGKQVVIIARQPDGHWPGLPSQVRMLIDADGAVADKYGITVVPAAVLVDTDGWMRQDVAFGPEAIRQAMTTQGNGSDAPRIPGYGHIATAGGPR